MKLALETSEYLIKDGKSYALVRFKSILPLAHYQQLLGRQELLEVDVEYKEEAPDAEISLQEAAEELGQELEPPPPKKGGKGWLA